MINESNFYWFFLGYAALAYLVNGIFDKLWWWFVDKNLEENKPEGGFSKEYFAEKYGVELSDTYITTSGPIQGISEKVCFWLCRVLLGGGIAGTLGMILAENFGHQEYFIWPGMCLGAFIGGVSATIFLLRERKERIDSTNTSEEIPDRTLKQSEIRSAEVGNETNSFSNAQYDWHFADFPQSSERVSRKSVGGHTLAYANLPNELPDRLEDVLSANKQITSG